ncbi:MAG: hypothetical protein QOD38_1207 [Acidimicrobiaceae bacterium]|jgi:glycosyltransferase involved in cell wall biosynthesis
MDSERISVVVATRDRPSMLQHCLESVRGALRAGDELIVVDSASREPATIRQLADAHDARYLRCDVPGASYARNVGWRAASNGIIAFIDDDVSVRPDWADAVAAALAEDQGLGFVTGRLDLPDPERHFERPVAVFDHDASFDIGPSTDEPYGHGANHAVRRAALEQVRGFDERLGAGQEFRAAEDLDLWDRLIRGGFVGRYVPEVVGYHDQWRRRRHFVGLDWSYGYGGGVRVAKLVRADVRRGLHSTRLFLWDWGAKLFWRHLWYRQVFLAELTVIRMCGVLVGLARGIVIPIEDGHLAPRQPRGGPPRDDRRAGRR